MPTTISDALHQDPSYFPQELIAQVEPLYPAFNARQFDDLTIYSSLATLESISKARCAALLLYLSEKIDLNQIKTIAGILSLDSDEVLLIGITSRLSKISPACQDIYTSRYTEQVDPPPSIQPLLQVTAHIKSGIRASYLGHMLKKEPGMEYFCTMLAIPRFKEALLHDKHFPHTLISSEGLECSPLYWILLNKRAALIQVFLLNEPFKKEFFGLGTFVRELVKKQPSGSSLLYMVSEESPDMLQYMIAHPQLKQRLSKSKSFIPELLKITSSQSSALSRLLSAEEGLNSFNALLSGWGGLLVDNPQFIEAIFESDIEGYSAIMYLFRPSAILVLRNLFTFSTFKERILTSAQFISILLKPAEKNRQSVYELLLLTQQDGSLFIIEFLKNETFKKNLLTDKDFLNALFEPSITIDGVRLSLFEQLILNDSYKLFFTALFAEPSVKDSILNDQRIVTNLLKQHPTKGFILYHFILPPLIKGPAGFFTITDWVKNQQFRKNLVSQPEFLNALYLKKESQNLSILEYLLLSNHGLDILHQLFLEESFKSTLINGDHFIPALLRVFKNGLSGLCVVTSTAEGRAMLIPLITQNPLLKNKILSHPDFLNTLLVVGHMGFSPLYSLVRIASDIPNEVHLNTPTVFDQPLFFNTLLARRAEPRSLHHQDFALAHMVHRFDVYPSLVKAIFSSAQFATWLSNAAHLTLFISSFFTQIDYHPTLHHNLFAQLLLKDKKGEILIQLLGIVSVRQEIMAHLKLPVDVSSFLFDLLKVDPGRQLIYALYQHQRTALLKINSLEGLFLNPQIQTLIRLQHIKPEWFLFLALQGPKPLQAATFFLNQSISPWVTTSSGQYLNDFIKGLAVTDRVKTALLQLVKRACWDYSHKQIHILAQPEESTPPISPMEIEEDSPDETNPSKRVKQQDEREVDEHGVSDAGAAVAQNLHPEQRIQGVPDAEIIAFNEAINAILTCMALADYHQAFKNLAGNTSFRSSLYFPTVKNKLVELSPIMLNSASNNNVPPYDPSCKLNKCPTDVVDGLNFLYQLFTGGTIALFYRSARQDTIAQYNKLLGVANGNELHSPDAPLRAIFLPTEFPLHDPFLTRWSLNQIQWVAQDLLFVHLKAMLWLRRELLAPIVTLFVDTLIEQMKPSLTDAKFLPIFEETSRTVRNVFQTVESFEPITPQIDSATITLSKMKLIIDLGQINGESPWYHVISSFNKSPLREKEPKLNNDAFFSLLGVTATTEDYFSYIVNLEDIHQIIMQFMTIMEKSFQAWYEKQTHLPQPKQINHYSNLLWRFLTDTVEEAQQKEVTTLISKLPQTVDACALIKYTITQHQHELVKLKEHQLTKAISPSDISIFSILCANPFYGAWFLEHQLDGRRNQYGSWNINYYPPQKATGFNATIWRGDPKRLSKLFLNTISQQGTLFTQLAIIKQQYPKSFQAIIKFLGLSLNLYQYDSLLPVLYDMQHSNHVNHEERGLVKELIQINIQNAISLQENTVYWDLCCTASPISADFLNQISTQMKENPWLTPPPSIRAYLFNEDPEPKLQSAGQLSIFNQGDQQPSSAPPHGLSPG